MNSTEVDEELARLWNDLSNEYKIQWNSDYKKFPFRTPVRIIQYQRTPYVRLVREGNVQIQIEM